MPRKRKPKAMYDGFGRRYPEVHGKVVDFIPLRYACDMFVVGADFCDFKTGDFEMIREYMRPIPR